MTDAQILTALYVLGALVMWFGFHDAPRRWRVAATVLWPVVVLLMPVARVPIALLVIIRSWRGDDVSELTDKLPDA